MPENTVPDDLKQTREHVVKLEAEARELETRQSVALEESHAARGERDLGRMVEARTRALALDDLLEDARAALEAARSDLARLEQQDARERTLTACLERLRDLNGFHQRLEERRRAILEFVAPFEAAQHEDFAAWHAAHAAAIELTRTLTGLYPDDALGSLIPEIEARGATLDPLRSHPPFSPSTLMTDAFPLDDGNASGTVFLRAFRSFWADNQAQERAALDAATADTGLAPSPRYRPISQTVPGQKVGHNDA